MILLGIKRVIFKGLGCRKRLYVECSHQHQLVCSQGHSPRIEWYTSMLNMLLVLGFSDIKYTVQRLDKCWLNLIMIWRMFLEYLKTYLERTGDGLPQQGSFQPDMSFCSRIYFSQFHQRKGFSHEQWLYGRSAVFSPSTRKLPGSWTWKVYYTL